MSIRTIAFWLLVTSQSLPTAAAPPDWLSTPLGQLIPRYFHFSYNEMTKKEPLVLATETHLFFGAVAKALAEKCGLPRDPAQKSALDSFHFVAYQKSLTAPPDITNKYRWGAEIGKKINCSSAEAEQLASVLSWHASAENPFLNRSYSSEALAILKSSQIVKRHQAANNGLPTIDTSGLKRGDFVSQIFVGRWSWVANSGSQNLNYYIRTLRNIDDRCPAFRIRDRFWEVQPYVFRAGEHNFLTGWKRDSNTPVDPVGAIAGALLVLSPEADHDTPLLLWKHPCNSSVLARYVENLFTFAQVAASRPFQESRMPGPETEQGKRLFRIFENCTHRAENGLADEWCGCYVRALFDSKVSDPILALLENNPFADARTYMEAVIKSISSGAKLYECAQEGGRNLDTYRFSQPEKVTACLQSEKPCLYRSHWADFTISGGSCNPTLTSKSHGGPAMSCEAVSKQLQK